MSNDDDLDDNIPPVTPNTGDRIEVFCPTYNHFDVGEATLVQGGKHQVTYDDGDVELLNMDQ